MKVTTLFGHSSSGPGGVGGNTKESSNGGMVKSVVKAGHHQNIEDINRNEFTPIVSSPTPTGGIMPGAPPAVERASSEVLYSSISSR